MQKRNKIITDVLTCCLITFLVYVWSLNRSWIFYDERLLYDEDMVPILSSLNEIVEYLTTFGFNISLISGNPLYTSNLIQRSNLLGAPLILFIEFLFKKNAFYYHCLNLFFHGINIVIVYFILKKCFSDYNKKTRLLIILLTTLWSLHPANAECILLSTNIGALMSYSVYFLLFLDFLHNSKSKSKLRLFLIPFVFLLPTIPNEYIFSLPLIIFIYSFITNKNNLKTAISESSPYFIGLLFFISYVLISMLKSFNGTGSSSISLILERIFWLAPQIFLHAIKITFFPLILSIDQSALVKIGNSLHDPYSIASLIVLGAWLILPLLLYLKSSKYLPLLLFTWLFFISFLPFSQMLMPSYCLFAERYIYSPFFFMIFSLAVFLNSLSNVKSKNIAVIILSFIIVIFGVRTYTRTLDWGNNCTLIHSFLETNPNLLYKGLRTDDLAYNCVRNEDEKRKYLNESNFYFEQAIEELKYKKALWGDKLPKVIKSYGLDYDFLIIKAISYISNKEFNSNTNDEHVYFSLLERFKPYLKDIESFDARTLEMYANLLVKTHNMAEAKKVFLYAYKKYSYQPFILVSLIRLERDFYNNLPEAKKYLTEALSLQPYSKEILYEAMKYYQKENNLLQYGRYSYLYGLRTGSKLAYQEALTVFLTLNDLSKSKRIIEKLFYIDSNDPSTLYLASSYFIKIKDFQKAISFLEQGYKKLNPRENIKLAFNITNTLSKLFQATGNFEQANFYLSEMKKYNENL